jgi:hypothetical protein
MVMRVMSEKEVERMTKEMLEFYKKHDTFGHNMMLQIKNLIDDKLSEVEDFIQTWIERFDNPSIKEFQGKSMDFYLDCPNFLQFVLLKKIREMKK